MTASGENSPGAGSLPGPVLLPREEAGPLPRSDEASGPTRRQLLQAGLVVPVWFLSGCGNPYDLPALAASSPPLIRALLGGRRRSRARLAADPQAWEIGTEGGRSFSRRGQGAFEVKIGPGERGITVEGQDTGATVLRLRAERDFLLEGIRYPGELWMHLDGDKVRFVNRVDLETYVAGVIPNEMAPQATPAAYRAQAVAARTYGWIHVTRAGAADSTWHVTDDQSSQVYTGLAPRYDVPYAPMRQHAANTAGVILTWESRPFPAYYSSTCGGHTTDARTSLLDPGGATEPLRGVRCDFCTTSPRYRWAKRVPDAQVIKGHDARGRPITAPVHAMEITRRGAGGWAAEVTTTYGPGRKPRALPGPDFRSALRLDSHLIDSMRRATSSEWAVEGRGWGHGVGMCQWGAMERAKQGFSEADVLSWYYPGAAFTRVY